MTPQRTCRKPLHCCLRWWNTNSWCCSTCWTSFVPFCIGQALPQQPWGWEQVLLEYQKGAWKLFPLFGWGVAGSTVCCFGLGSVFEKIWNSMNLLDSTYYYVDMFPVSGKAVSLVCCLFFFSFNYFSYFTGIYFISVLDLIYISIYIYLIENHTFFQYGDNRS